MGNGLSVIVITRDEEMDIQACLESVKAIADEIVVVDSGSTDRTVEIARKFTPLVSHLDWKGYGPQKQAAMDKAKGPWILNIDADERVTDALQSEIKQTLASNPGVNGYDIPFRHFFLGRRLRFGGVAGETHLRLFRKEKSSYGASEVHEGIRVESPTGALKNPIDHMSYRSIQDYLTKCNNYTSLIARQKFQKGQRFHFWHHLRLPFEFLVRYFLKLGFLDGGPGLTYSILSSYYVWLKFLKLKDLENQL